MPLSETFADAIRTYWLSFGIYFVVGGLAALVEWAVFYAAIVQAGLNYLVAACLGFVVATLFNYLLSIRLNFNRRQDRSTSTEMLMVYAVSGIGLIINLAVMTAAIEWLHVWVMAAKVCGTSVAFFWNYLSRQFFVFDRRPRHTL